jgi:hypothetical protein
MVAACCLVPALALAEGDPEARQIAEELLTLTRVDKMLEEMRGQMSQMMMTQLRAADVPEAQAEKVAELQKRMMDLAFEELSFAKMKDDYVEVYASVFTVEELRDLVAFYRTPTGQAFVEKMPELTRRSMEFVNTRAMKLLPEMKKMITELTAGTAAAEETPDLH